MSDGNDDHFFLTSEWIEKWVNMNTALLSKVVQREDFQRITLRDLYSYLFNSIPSITVEDFKIGRAILPESGYEPGVFPFGFDEIISFSDLLAYSMHLLVVTFDIEINEMSRIKARGYGEIEINQTAEGAISVRAREGWNIEEVKEIEIDNDEDTNIAFKMVEKLKDVIEKLIIALIVKTLYAFLIS